jgi:hypothetical protein
MIAPFVDCHFSLDEARKLHPPEYCLSLSRRVALRVNHLGVKRIIWTCNYVFTHADASSLEVLSRGNEDGKLRKSRQPSADGHPGRVERDFPLDTHCRLC